MKKRTPTSLYITGVSWILVGIVLYIVRREYIIPLACTAVACMDFIQASVGKSREKSAADKAAAKAAARGTGNGKKKKKKSR